VREAIAGVLQPDPELAQFIRTEGLGSNDDDVSGIIAGMWPNMGTLTPSSVTSSTAQYVSPK
jgi:auxin responsive GH3 family protein